MLLINKNKNCSTKKTMIALTFSAFTLYGNIILASSVQTVDPATIKANLAALQQNIQDQIAQSASAGKANSQASIQSNNDQQFAENPYLATNQTNQQASYSTKSATTDNNNALNASAVTASLQPLSIEGFASDSNNLDNTGDADTVANLQTSYSSTLDDLSINITASDILTPNYYYTEGDSSSTPTSDDAIAFGGTLSNGTYGIPTINYDAYFDSSSLLGVDNYIDANAETAASYFIKFATNPIPLALQYLPNLPQLQLAITKAVDSDNPSANTTKSAITREFITSSLYKQFIIDERNMAAQQSLTSDAYNYIYTQKKSNYQANPDDNLNALYAAIHPDATAVPTTTDSDGNTLYAYPSEEETTNYLATHDLADPNYYQHVASESEANVLRDTLITNKLIAKELNNQNEIHERELALLANISLQVTNQSKTAAAAAKEGDTINSWIKSIPTPSTSPSDIPTLTDDPTAQAKNTVSS